MQAWVASLVQSPLATQWLVIHVTPAEAKKAFFNFGPTVFERLRSDFGKATDRCFQIKDRDVAGDQAGADAWTALTSRIQHDLFTVFDARFAERERVLSCRCGR